MIGRSTQRQARTMDSKASTFEMTVHNWAIKRRCLICDGNIVLRCACCVCRLHQRLVRHRNPEGEGAKNAASLEGTTTLLHKQGRRPYLSNMPFDSTFMESSAGMLAYLSIARIELVQY